MSVKRLLVISILMSLVVVILGRGRLIQAETAAADPAMEPELEPAHWRFNHIANDRLTVTASGADGCPAVAEDE
ncbi:MAG: hypothetical protein JSW55_02960, partial [Chloroflexota bacterium]